jgi:ElaB/YqjD/DUF883 family membrane-anchored ribosome-binding protein
MPEKDTYTKQLEQTLEKYKNKISKIEEFVESYKGSNRRELLNQRAELQEKFEEGKKMLKQIQGSSEKEYENLKEGATTLFESLKDAIYDFSHYLTLDQLSRMKGELTDLGHQTVDEAEALVRQNPLSMAVGALSFGFILGMLFARSK